MMFFWNSSTDSLKGEESPFDSLSLKSFSMMFFFNLRSAFREKEESAAFRFL
jgi:hypothetical protein